MGRDFDAAGKLFLCVHACSLYACGVSNRALVMRILYLCDDVAIRALCRASPSHNVALDVNFYKGFRPVFIFWWLDTTPACRLLVSCDAQLRSKTAEKQSSVLGWESPAMWTAGLLCLASEDMKTYALTAWPEHLKSGNCTGLVFIQPTHHFLSKTISGLDRMSWSLAIPCAVGMLRVLKDFKCIFHIVCRWIIEICTT